jgi:hypothetical protein
MKASLVASLALVLTAGPALANEQLSALAWMQGCWSRAGSEPGTVEQWMAPAGGTMLGMSRTVKGGKTIEHEFIQIREVEPGVLGYIAMPSRQATATFKLAKQENDTWTFENPAHDFPQRVIYRKDGADLAARIEGTRNGKTRAIDFPMKRVACN